MKDNTPKYKIELTREEIEDVVRDIFNEQPKKGRIILGKTSPWFWTKKFHELMVEEVHRMFEYDGDDSKIP